MTRSIPPEGELRGGSRPPRRGNPEFFTLPAAAAIAGQILPAVLLRLVL